MVFEDRAVATRRLAEVRRIWGIGESNSCEPVRVRDLHRLAVRADETVALKPGEHPADGFQLHPKVTADLFTRHAQIELSGRKAAPLEPLREVEEKRR